MEYELIISERADELTDRLAVYLLNNLKNPGAASLRKVLCSVCCLNHTFTFMRILAGTADRDI